MQNMTETLIGEPTAKFEVLGIRVDAVQIPDTVAILESWIAQRGASHYVAVTGMHGVSEAASDPSFRAALDAASLVVCDGMPLVWLGRLRGHKLRRRVYGHELLVDFCCANGSRFRLFFCCVTVDVLYQLTKSV